MANGAATGLYLGARLGPGPRDGLMTGYVARRPGRSVRLVRTVIEVTVLALGWLLGGTVGLGTVAYALAIGPLAQVFIPLFAVARPAAGRRHPDPAVCATGPAGAATEAPTAPAGPAPSRPRRRWPRSADTHVTVARRPPPDGSRTRGELR